MGNTETITTAELFTAEMIPALIGMVVGFIILAFFGFKLLRIELVIAGALIGYSFGSGNLAALIGDGITGVNVALILGIACAVIGVLISAKVYRLMIFLYSGLIGFVVGSILFPGLIGGFNNLPVDPNTLTLIMSIVLGIVVAFVIYRFFKPLYIVLTSICGMIFAGVLAAMLIFNGNDTAATVGLAVGLVLGVVAMIHQFKANRDRYL